MNSEKGYAQWKYRFLNAFENDLFDHRLLDSLSSFANGPFFG